MKAASKWGVLLAVALTAAIAMAGSAQADHGVVDIDPDDTAITAMADQPSLAGIVCDTGILIGRTGIDSDIVNLELEFFGNCSVAGLDAQVTCSDAVGPNAELGTARWHALTFDTDEGEIDPLNEDFLCQATVPEVCTVSVEEQELPVPGGVNRADLIGEDGDPAIEVEVDLLATIDNPLCGPPSEVVQWTGLYELGPGIRFDPAQ